MFRIVLACLLIFAVAPAHARKVGDTEILSEAALSKLINNKGLTLQWLWGAKRGKLLVSEKPEGVVASGQQGPHNGDQLTMTGMITRIEAKSFKFKGRIAIVDNETTEVCVREGTYTFRITGNRKYWRLKEQEARCPGRADLTDYVDIYF